MWTGKQISAMILKIWRKDLNFLGWHNVKVRIAPKTTLALASPKSGSRKPYTISPYSENY